jgi:beta-lactamase class D
MTGRLTVSLVAVLFMVAGGSAHPQTIPYVYSAPGECFIVVRAGGPDASDLAPECSRKTAPASTFKIPHALIALQTGVIDSTTVVKWDGTRYDFESWQRDHTLDSAIKRSVYPFFQRTARLIGRERMRRGLASLQYGADTFDGELTAFWTNGDLVVSPYEQVAFLRRFVSGQLPIDPSHIAAVKAALIMPQGRITNAAGVHEFPLHWPVETVVRAKTGNTTVNGERVSWLVGYLELGREVDVFVSRVRSTNRSLPGTAGAQLGVRELNRVRAPLTN